MLFGPQYVPEPWKKGDAQRWSGPSRGGSRHIISHEDHFKNKDNPRQLYFDCNIQVAEQHHLSQLMPGVQTPQGNVPAPYRHTFAYGWMDGSDTRNLTSFQRVDLRAITALNQRELGSYAIKHYKLDKQQPCLYTEPEWRAADSFWFLADAPIRPNSVAQTLFPQNGGREFIDFQEYIP